MILEVIRNSSLLGWCSNVGRIFFGGRTDEGLDCGTVIVYVGLRPAHATTMGGGGCTYLSPAQAPDFSNLGIEKIDIVR